jgi:hypothetical protein
MVLLRLSDVTMYEFIETMPIETLPIFVILVKIFSDEKQSIIPATILWTQSFVSRV